MSGGVLAIDQGTSGAKALLINGRGEVAARASRPVRAAHPRPGWAEQDGEMIWRSVVQVIDDIVTAGHEVTALAITNQRETVGMWTMSGEALAPFILWQCRRTSDLCAGLKDHEDEIVSRTGLVLDPMFSATKVRWLLDHVPGARDLAAREELKAGTVDAWLIWRLTGGLHATDHSNASRTQLMNLETLAWDPELAEIFDVPLRILPEIRPSGGVFGVTAPGVTALPAGIPIMAIMGDSHAALFGHGFDGPGRMKATCGTGSSLMTVTPSRVRSGHGLSSTVAWSCAGKVHYALEGNIVVSGQALTFAAKLLGCADEAELIALASTVPDSGGVVMVPAMSGLGAPHWKDEARGLICGMTLGTGPAHVARAALDAVALQIRDVLAAMEADLGGAVPSLSIDGGVAAEDRFAQRLADITDRTVLRPSCQELSALGVARMAIRENDGVEPVDLGGEAEFHPAMPASERQRLLDAWRDGLFRTMVEVGYAS